MNENHEKITFRLSLIENAYDSLNESLAYVESALQDPTRWKFAVLNLVHALELVIKQRLHEEHELLVWENVDQPGKTVSLEKSLSRLTKIKIGIKSSDLDAIRTAIRWRNTITHYEVDLVAEEVRENYLLIFEFLDEFHDNHFEGSLSEKIQDSHVQTAMDLAHSFKKEFIEFRGRRMHRKWARLLIAAQNTKRFWWERRSYARLRWGAETHWSTWMKDDSPLQFCPDCAAEIGEFHGPNCDKEECPKCGGQLLSCGCDFEDSPFWNLEVSSSEESEMDQT